LDDAGNPIEGEVYSMEPKLNENDFMKAESIKMRDIDETMQLYRSLVQSMGNLWQKKLIGLKVHGRRSTMSNYIYKLLTIDGVIPHAND
jgi:hypothetical protein